MDGCLRKEGGTEGKKSERQTSRSCSFIKHSRARKCQGGAGECRVINDVA